MGEDCGNNIDYIILYYNIYFGFLFLFFFTPLFICLFMLNFQLSSSGGCIYIYVVHTWHNHNDNNNIGTFIRCLFIHMYTHTYTFSSQYKLLMTKLKCYFYTFSGIFNTIHWMGNPIMNFEYTSMDKDTGNWNEINIMAPNLILLFLLLLLEHRVTRIKKLGIRLFEWIMMMYVDGNIFMTCEKWMLNLERLWNIYEMLHCSSCMLC